MIDRCTIATSSHVSCARTRSPNGWGRRHLWRLVAGFCVPLVLFDCASDSARPSSESVGETKQAFSVSDIEKYLPPEIRDIIDFAGGVIGTFTLISTVVSVVTKVLTFAHILRADPDANAQRFAALTQHLDAIAGSLSWQISEMAREQRLADETAAVISAGEILESTGGPVDINSPTALQSLTALTESEEPSAFQRLFNDAVTNGDGVWKNNQRDRPEIVNGLVYDWRVGVPALLMLTSMRLNVLGAIDPNFANLIDDHPESVVGLFL